MAVVFDVIGAITIAALSGPLAVAIFSDESYKTYIALFAITMALTPLAEIPFAHIRAEQKPWLFFTFSTLKLILQVTLNLYLIVYLNMRVEGVIYSAVISSAVMAVVLSAYSLSRAGINVTIATCKKLFAFSLPLKLAVIGSFYMTFGDRYILNMYTDLSEVGIYSLGYKFAFVFTILAWIPFEKIWDSEKYEICKKPDAKLIYQKVFLNISSIMILFGLCISLFTKDLLRIMSDPAFFHAYEVVPIVIVAYIFQSWTRYCELGILLENKTIHIAYAGMIAVLVITIAYFTLIPAYGMHGAAWATVIGFYARFYWVNRKGKQYYDMDLPWGKVGLTAILALLAYALSLFVPDNLVASIGLRTVILASFVALYFSLPILSREAKKEVWTKVRNLAGAR